MGIMNTIFGNVSEMDIASLQKEFGALLCEGERIERAYKLIRDKWVFTNKRLIIQDVQGVTGKKREYLSVPYRSIERFSIETAGTFDMDAEMKIWIRGCEEPLEQNFGRRSYRRKRNQSSRYRFHRGIERCIFYCNLRFTRSQWGNSSNDQTWHNRKGTRRGKQRNRYI